MTMTLDNMIGERCTLIAHQRDGERLTFDDVEFSAFDAFGVLVSVDSGASCFLPWASVEGILFRSDDGRDKVAADLLSFLDER
ncbi:MAG: hypothetical protein DCC55_27995 [Chloroflexi bacterium]|nr:MAG: hypothetical protein DCC55_27995 [Chloroflexota bacterium]